MSSIDLHVKGLPELYAAMQQIAPKLEKNVMRGGLRAGMKKVQPVAKQKIHSVSGLLAKGLKITTGSRGGIVTARLKATGKHRSVAHLVEYGTAAHSISAKSKGMLSFLNVFRKEVMHPGAKPHPFMRPSLDQEAGRAVVAVGEYIKTRLETKYGLDTADIVIEGEE